jgi:hypothetical protein
MPKPSPRVALIQQGGTPAYVRDGRVYEGGLFGGDLEEAVRGNPEAEAHASSYKAGMIGGFVTSILGAVGLGAGLGIFAAGTNTSGPSSTGGRDLSERQTIGTGLLLGGLAAYVTGFALVMNAQPHMWDAINVYNDGLPVPPLPSPLAPQPGAAAPGPLPPVAPTSPAPVAAPPPASSPPPAATPPATGAEPAPNR